MLDFMPKNNKRGKPQKLAERVYVVILVSKRKTAEVRVMGWRSPRRCEPSVINGHLGSEVENAPRNVRSGSLAHEVSGEQGHKGKEVVCPSFTAKDLAAPCHVLLSEPKSKDQTAFSLGQKKE